MVAADTPSLTFNAPANRQMHEDMGVVEGWNSSFDCLRDLLGEMQR